MNQGEALRAADLAAGLVEDGRLADAEVRYREALALSDPADPRTAQIHTEYGDVLTRLHKGFDAGKEYERALFLTLKKDRDESRAEVFVARYFLGEHYLRMGEPDSARLVIAPSLAATPTPLAWMIEAQALHLSGSDAAAREAGERALELSADADQREQIRERLSELLEG